MFTQLCGNILLLEWTKLYLDMNISIMNLSHIFFLSSINDVQSEIAPLPIKSNKEINKKKISK